MHNRACMHLPFVRLTLVSLILLSASEQIFASSSGLNNIPTADTAPHLTLVIQEYSTFGAKRKPDYTAGFKFGLAPWKDSEWQNRFEWGLDSHLASGDAGPAVFQFKYATQPRPNLPALGIGIA